MAIKKQEAYDGSTPLNSIRQETFVSNLLSNMNQTDAYMAAYPTCNNRETAKVNASRLLLTNANVQLRLAYKRSQTEQKTEITVVSLQRKLLNLALKAEKDKKYTAAASCYAHLLKTVGGFQADAPSDKAIEMRQIDAEARREVAKALDTFYSNKYLAARPEVIEAENVVVLDDM